MDFKQIITDRIARKIRNSGLNAQAAIVQLQQEGKIAQDYIVPVGALRRGQDIDTTHFTSNGHVGMDFEDRRFTLNKNAVTQLGEKLSIPPPYLTALSQGNQWERDLAARILNDHTHNSPRDRVLVRAVGSEVRAVLSEKYRRLNTLKILTGFLEAASDCNVMLADGHMDDTRVWIEVLYPEPVEIVTPKNGTVYVAFGGRFSSSDYGDGALDIRTFFLQGVCLNGAVRESMLREIHLGKKLADDIIFSERTYELDTQTIMSAVQDICRQVFGQENIQRRVNEIIAASDVEIDMVKVLKSLAKGGRISKDEQESVTKLLMDNNEEEGIQGAGTIWKLIQGMTSFAKTTDERRCRELQEIAGAMFETSKIQEYVAV